MKCPVDNTTMIINTFTTVYKNATLEYESFLCLTCNLKVSNIEQTSELQRKMKEV
jgi:hypothetical protein